MELAEAIRKEVKSEFKKTSPKTEGYGDGCVVKFKVGGVSVAYHLIHIGDELTTNNPDKLGKLSEEDFKRIVKVNEKIARKTGCKQINMDVIYSKERERFEELGYEFNNGRGKKEL